MGRMITMDMLLIQTIIVLQILSLVLCEVAIEIKLKHYENPSSKELNGDCCDIVFGSCSWNKCDNMFTICLDHPGSSTSFSTCPIGSEATTRVFEDNDNFNFPSSLPGGVSNPFTKTHANWQDGFRIKILVYDYDPTNSNDLVDRIYSNFYLTPTPFDAVDNPWTDKTVQGTRARIEFQYRVKCTNNYYGTDCSKYCVDTDNDSGHYTCDESGNKICIDGWAGASCDHDINECESTPCMNGGTCEHGLNSYVCNCPENWGGSLCHILQNACVSAPCANNATCESDLLPNDSSNYTCICEDGWTGKDCSDEIYECGSSPCMNDGVCQDLVNDWNCICKNGTSGRMCEIAVTTVIDLTTEGNTTLDYYTTSNDYTTVDNYTIMNDYTTDADNTEEDKAKPDENDIDISGGKREQSKSDDDGGVSDSVTYSMVVLGLLLIIFILAILLVRKKGKRKLEDTGSMEVPISNHPQIVAISNVQLDQATGGAIYETSIVKKKIPFEEDELGSFQNPVYMLTVEDLQAKNAKEENLYVELDDDKVIKDPEKEDPYMEMAPGDPPEISSFNPVTPSAQANLYFVD